jgi:hypothetical protein
VFDHNATNGNATDGSIWRSIAQQTGLRHAF